MKLIRQRSFSEAFCKSSLYCVLYRIWSAIAARTLNFWCILNCYRAERKEGNGAE